MYLVAVEVKLLDRSTLLREVFLGYRQPGLTCIPSEVVRNYPCDLHGSTSTGIEYVK